VQWRVGRDLFEEVVEAVDVSGDGGLVQQVDVHVRAVVAQQICQTNKCFEFVHVEEEHGHHVAHSLWWVRGGEGG
jgi:hypothetical protein